MSLGQNGKKFQMKFVANAGMNFAPAFDFTRGKEEKTKTVFGLHAAENYMKWLEKARAHAKKMSKRSWVTNDAKKYKPNWMLAGVWSAIADEWLTEKWQNKSENAKKNRSRMVLTHTSGLAPFDHHMVKIAKTTGQKPSPIDLFQATHTKARTGEWSSAKAKQMTNSMPRFPPNMAQFTPSMAQFMPSRPHFLLQFQPYMPRHNIGEDNDEDTGEDDDEDVYRP